MNISSRLSVFCFLLSALPLCQFFTLGSPSATHLRMGDKNGTWFVRFFHGGFDLLPEPAIVFFGRLLRQLDGKRQSLLCHDLVEKKPDGFAHGKAHPVQKRLRLDL